MKIVLRKLPKICQRLPKTTQNYPKLPKLDQKDKAEKRLETGRKKDKVKIRQKWLKRSKRTENDQKNSLFSHLDHYRR